MKAFVYKKISQLAKLWGEVGRICSLGHALGAQRAGLFHTSISLNAYFSVVAQFIFAEQRNSSLFREAIQI